MLQLHKGLIVAGAVAAGVLAIYVTRKGVAGAASAAAGAAVDAVGGAVSGTVGAIGAGVGLPTPDETTRDERVARWIIDRWGHLKASQWASAGAYLQALMLPDGSGTPPAPDTPVGRALWLPTASYDEAGRLASRYPASSGSSSDSWELPGWMTGS